MFRPAAKSAHGPVRFALAIDDPPRSRVPTHNLGGIVRIEYAANEATNAMLARVSPFLLPARALSLSLSLFPSFPLSRSASSPDDAAGYFVSTAVPRLRIIDYRRVR